MRHLINGYPINLRELTAHELEALVKMAERRIEAAHDDLEKLNGEIIRRDRFRQSIIT
jgi:hypothetical protein